MPEPAPDQLLEFDPHWFRRAVHGMGAGFVLYYLLPSTGWWGPVKTWGPWVLLLAAAAVEAVRMTGGIRSEHFFGLREYERTRVSGYIYFGFASVVLLTLVPQPIALPCLVGAALGDPLVGELRNRDRPLGSLVAGVLFGAGVFLIAGWGWLLALAGGVLLVVGESSRLPWLDDDLTMPLLPAAVLLALHVAGVLALPPDLIVWTLGEVGA